MQRNRVSAKGGFTLIELMVVITIISILAALIVPALQRAQATAIAANCSARARAIAATIAAYAPTWWGWTDPNAASFITDMGYKLKWDEGYYGEAPGTWYDPATMPPNASEIYASQISDYRCPSDPKPLINKHGIPISYAITSLFAGGNIMSVTGAPRSPAVPILPVGATGIPIALTADQLLAVKERGKRHPSGRTRDGVETVECHYVFADLHVSLGYNGPAIPGFKARAWFQGSPGNIQGVAESKLKNPEYETVWSTPLGTDGKWLYALNQLPVGGSEWNISHSDAQGWTWGAAWGQRWPRIFCWRWDGVIKFPKTGRYEFNLYQDRYGHESAAFGIGSMGDALRDPTNFTFFTPPNQGWALAYFKVISDVTDFYPIQVLYWSGSDWHGNWSYNWRLQDGMGVYDPLLNGTTGVVVGPPYLMHFP